MENITFILSVLILIGSICLLCSAIVNDGPMYSTGIIVMSLICGLSLLLTRLTYKELRNQHS